MKKETCQALRALEIFDSTIGDGGTEFFILSLLEHFDREKIQADCLTVYDCNYDYFMTRVEQNGSELYALNLPTHQTVIRKWFRTDLYRPVRSFLKEHPYDVIHIHGSSIAALTVLSAAAHRKGGPKIIVHSHSSGKDNQFKIMVFRFLASFSLRQHVDEYCACSRAAAEWKFMPKYVKRTVIVKNGIDLERFQFDPVRRSELRKKLGIPENAYVIGHVGRLDPVKNQSFLVEIFERIAGKEADTFLLLVGEGKDEEKLKSLVQEKELGNRVIFTGGVPNVPDYLCVMDVFVFPSLFEGLGTAAIEAQAMGLPVVASDTVPRETQVIENVRFLSLTADSKEWESAVLSFRNYERKDEHVTIRRAGYDVCNTIRQIEALYLS